VKLAWGNRVDGDFIAKLAAICFALGWPIKFMSWLMACMAFETGETFSPAELNRAGSGATGLIQFMPATAKDLGTTTEALAKMSAVRQLDYVLAYFKRYAPRIKTLSDLYMAILYPKAIGLAEDAPLFVEGKFGYRQNAPLDRDSNGIITKEEATYFVLSKLDKGMGYGNWKEVGMGEEKNVELTEELVRVEAAVAELRKAMLAAGRVSA